MKKNYAKKLLVFICCFALAGRLEALMLNNNFCIRVEEQQGNFALIEAAKKEDWEEVKRLIERGGDVNSRDPKSTDALLHYAVEKGPKEIVVFLVHRKRTDLNVIGNFCDTPLHRASKRGNHWMVKCLVENGADAFKDNGSYGLPVHCAAAKNYLEVVKYLVEIKPKLLNATTALFGQTPLMAASIYNSVAVVKYLLGKGADTWPTNSRGNTALHFAAKYGSLEIFKSLLFDGADIQVKNKEGKTPMDLVKEEDKPQIELFMKELKELSEYKKSLVQKKFCQRLKKNQLLDVQFYFNDSFSV